MRKLATLSILLLLISGCSWTNHFLGRQSGKKTTAQVFTNGQVSRTPWVTYEMKYEEIEKTYDDGTKMRTGTYREVLDPESAVANFIIQAEDGKSFKCECPIELVSFCMGLKKGEQVKVNGEAARADSAVLKISYIRRK